MVKMVYFTTQVKTNQPLNNNNNKKKNKLALLPISILTVLKFYQPLKLFVNKYLIWAHLALRNDGLPSYYLHLQYQVWNPNVYNTFYMKK